VIVANTFSDSALYDYESVTYRTVFGRSSIEARQPHHRRPHWRHHGGRSRQCRKNAMLLEPELMKRGSGSGFLLPLLVTNIDWNPNTRILTDQYSPSNLLNAIPRRPN